MLFASMCGEKSLKLRIHYTPGFDLGLRVLHSRDGVAKSVALGVFNNRRPSFSIFCIMEARVISFEFFSEFKTLLGISIKIGYL